MSNCAKIKNWDIANGEGLRTSIFFSGCEFHCKGCFNKEIWDFKVGEPFDIEYYDEKIAPTINEHVAGISILGGEPLHMDNIAAVAELVALFKMDFPNKNIWLWTGYDFDFLSVEINLIGGSDLFEWYQNKLEFILNNIDVLVDGQFIEEQRDLTLKWRGSRNQRVIDVKRSLEKGEVVLYCD